jgi:hypothetical protein
MLDQEEEILFKEKEEVENPKEDTDDNFVPARLAEPDNRPPLVHIEL